MALLTEQLAPGHFGEFIYSRCSHFDLFRAQHLDIALFDRRVDPEDADLKVYQDLLVFAFIMANLPPGSRMLDVGGGESRILEYFKREYECWNIDKLEGVGNGPTELEAKGIKLVRDYMGNFNPELPDGYFDLVFSISTLEHVPQDDPRLFESILADINRVLRPGGYSLHCLDVVWGPGRVWTNPILHHLYKYARPVTPFVPFEAMTGDPDLYVMSEAYFGKTWQKTTGKTYQEFGKPLSYNILWRKRENASG